ncbi:exocyst complex component SEC3A-like isoform X2 [Glycine soja]|uniref:exocyst complex component SEC3A-like isoform X2 n=1 Tax=Glycine soja TaxID=3848 RepID=UPI00103E0D8E|nr:exocyst complex component SEC3A-like isoform X2 [Glycine soja]
MYSTGGVLEPAKLYKLKHLSKVEVVANDPCGCTFTLVKFHDGRDLYVLVPDMYSVSGTEAICEASYRSCFGVFFFFMSSQSFACWADACVSCRDLITLEARVWLPQWTMRNIDDRNRLLLCFLNICKDVLGCLPKVVGIDVVEMALWAKIETRNNNLEMQSVNYKSLIEEFDKLLERSRVPSEVKEKRAELEKLKSTFVRRASEFLRNYFASLVDFMISDKSYFSQRGQLKRPDHADLRYKCRTYARLLQHLKSLDKNCLGPLRKAYCSFLNLLLRREAREFANELRASTKASRNPTVWLEGSTGSGQNVNATDTSTVSDAYAKMLTIFIPLLVDETSFFAHFMCFEVPTLVPPGGVVNGNKAGYDDDDDDLGIMDIDENDSKSGKNSAELEALNKSLKDLLDGIQAMTRRLQWKLLKLLDYS